MNMTTKLCGVLLSACLATHTAQATVIYDEGISGDLSGDNLLPTMLAVSEGSNVVTGSATSFPLDRDIFTFNVAADQQLVAIILDTLVSGDDQSFFAVASGNSIASLGSPADLLGNALIGNLAGTMQGDDLLDDLGAGTFPGSTGFTGALGPGTYTFWIQETTRGIQEYALDFQVRTAVPLPSTLALLLAGMMLLRKKNRGQTTVSRNGK